MLTSLLSLNKDKAVSHPTVDRRTLLRWLIGELGSQIEGDIALLEHIAGRLEAMAGRAP